MRQEEDFEISPVKIVEVDFLSQKKRIVPTAVQNNPAPANSSGSNYRAPSAANMVKLVRFPSFQITLAQNILILQRFSYHLRW